MLLGAPLGQVIVGKSGTMKVQETKGEALSDGQGRGGDGCLYILILSRV